MKYPILIFISIIMIIICLVYLPYGYSESKYTNWYSDGNDIVFKNNKVKWIYLKHHFVLDRPKSYDPIRENYYDKKAFKDEDIMLTNFVIDDLQILWHIVIIETLIVILITGGLFYTFKWYDNK